jgi:hypothetical protein
VDDVTAPPAQTTPAAPAAPAPPKKDGEMTEQELKDAQAQLEKDRAALAADQEKNRQAEFAARNSAHLSFATSLIEGGRLPPGHKDDLVKALNELPATVLEFSGDVKETGAAFFMRLLGGAKPIIQFGAQDSPNTEFNALDDKGKAAAAEAARVEAENSQRDAWKGPARA